MQLNGARILIECLIREGVNIIFGYPGGSVLDIYDELPQYGEQLRHVLVRHEQAAVHAADGYARATGKVGVCMATSGPGATNTVTGIATAYCDSIPMVIFTGQVPTGLIGNDAFQEVDIAGITRPCTKHNYVVKDVKDLAKVVRQAFYLARSGRPGPVLVDLPKNVLQGSAEFVWPEDVSLRSYNPTYRPNYAQIRKVVDALYNAERPLLFGGGGVIMSNASEEFRNLAKNLSIPVTCSLMGLGAFPCDHPQWLGMLGMHGTYAANKAVSNADLLIAVGVRFDDRVTGRLSSFAPKATIVHIDIDPTSIHKNVNVRIPVVGDCRNSLVAIREHLAAREPLPWKERFAAWQGQLDEWKQEQPITWTPGETTIKPQEVIKAVDKITEGKAILTTEVGRAALQLHGTAHPAHLGRPRDHGLRLPRRHRRAVRLSQQARHRRVRRRIVPDEPPGTHHRRQQQAAGQGTAPEQRLSGHGPPAPGSFLRRPPQRRGHPGSAGLREARRSLWGRRLPRRQAGRS